MFLHSFDTQVFCEKPAKLQTWITEKICVNMVPILKMEGAFIEKFKITTSSILSLGKFCIHITFSLYVISTTKHVLANFI